MAAETLKICPNCRHSDRTSFSSCRYCGTRYDAIILPANGSGLDRRLVIAAMAGILLIGGMKYLESANRAAKHERLASIRADIQAVNRPRMLEFYATWCGPCQQYGPVVDELQRKYYDVIDIQRLNIDDQKNKKLAALLEVHVVPTTCMFDRKGEEVNEVKGALNRETLDKYLQNLEAVK